MRNHLLAIALLGSIFLLAAGCTESITPAVPGSGTLNVPTPGPTMTLPQGKSVTVQVNEKDTSYATITVIFSGGEGQIATKDIRVRLTRADGEVLTDHIPPEKGAELILQGTRETDRMEVFVTLNTGDTYKIIDMLLPYRTRG